MEMAGEEEEKKGVEEEEEEESIIKIPNGRVKRIMKLDKEIKKINSEALFLVSSCVHLFLQSLVQRSAAVAREKKRKTLKLDHLRIAVKRHRPTSDFLLDSLHAPPSTAVTNDNKPSSLVVSTNHHNKPLPTAARRIDHFFHKHQ